MAVGGWHDGHHFGSREAIQIDDDSEDDIEEVQVDCTMLLACMVCCCKQSLSFSNCMLPVLQTLYTIGPGTKSVECLPTVHNCTDNTTIPKPAIAILAYAACMWMDDHPSANCQAPVKKLRMPWHKPQHCNKCQPCYGVNLYQLYRQQALTAFMFP
jgi:hypothetical protein